MKSSGSAPQSRAKSLFEDPLILPGILVALLVIILPLLYFLLRTKKRGRAILLMGPSESGKTAIFAHLTTGRDVDTVISTVPNEAVYKGNGAKASLILKDLPGHDRVRNKWWEAHKVGVRGIVCVIDASGGNKVLRDTAEVLYWILTDSVVNSVRPDILIFANKQDQPTAKGAKLVRAQLEREMTTLRLTKLATLQSLGNTSTSSKTLGKLDKDFDFDHVAPVKVEFAEGCAKAEHVELTQLINWLDSVA